MQLGAVFPQTELGADPVVIRDYVQAVEGLGYHHLLAYEHVIGAHPDRLTHGWRMYTHEDQFHEPLVLFAYLAAVTERLEFVTGILILPMRQTVLVAKQAAELDVLSGGRLRLGVGIGRNRVEYEAMNANFHDRGRRSAEQVQVLRALWTQELVTFEGQCPTRAAQSNKIGGAARASQWHTISNAGINPLPVQRPIPIWFGGGADPVLRRIARLGDGWFPQFHPGQDAEESVARLHRYAREAGRDPAEIGIEGSVTFAGGNEDEWQARAAWWQTLGASYLTVNTMGAGLSTADEHVAALRRCREALAGV